MSRSATTVRTAAAGVIMSMGIAGGAAAQGTGDATPAVTRAPVCAKGVRVYTDKSQVPVPFDTLRMPPTNGPVMVTSPEEAEAAELAMRGRAGSVGATAVLVTDEVSDEGGMQRMHRSVAALFVRADSTRAQQACK